MATHKEMIEKAMAPWLARVRPDARDLARENALKRATVVDGKVTGLAEYFIDELPPKFFQTDNTVSASGRTPSRKAGGAPLSIRETVAAELAAMAARDEGQS